MKTLPLGSVVVVGLGLIGGSFALGLKAHRLCREVVGCGRSESTLKRAQELGLIDRYETDLAAAVKTADVVMLAAPIGSTEDLLRAMAPGLDGETIVTDAGSVKGNVVAAVKAVFGTVPPGSCRDIPLLAQKKWPRCRQGGSVPQA